MWSGPAGGKRGTCAEDKIATLEETVKHATHMLAAAAKGQDLNLGTDVLKTEKGLNDILKEGNAAIRSLQFYIRETKESAKAAKAQGGAAKAKAKAKKWVAGPWPEYPAWMRS